MPPLSCGTLPLEALETQEAPEFFLIPLEALTPPWRVQQGSSLANASRSPPSPSTSTPQATFPPTAPPTFKNTPNILPPPIGSHSDGSDLAVDGTTKGAIELDHAPLELSQTTHSSISVANTETHRHSDSTDAGPPLRHSSASCGVGPSGRLPVLDLLDADAA